MERKEANLAILEIIKQNIEKYPDQRFSQLLCNLNIVEQEDDIWKEKREELFATGAGTIMNMLKRNQNPAWKNIYMRYGFESAKDIELFVRKEAIKRGIL